MFSCVPVKMLQNKRLLMSLQRFILFMNKLYLPCFCNFEMDLTGKLAVNRLINMQKSANKFVCDALFSEMNSPVIDSFVKLSRTVP